MDPQALGGPAPLVRARHVLGEVEVGLELDPQPLERGAKQLDLAPELARDEALGLIERGLGAGADQRGDALDLIEAQPAVLEGATREVAGSGRDGSGREHLLEHARDVALTRMNVQLDHVLAGERARPRHPRDQDLLAGAGRVRERAQPEHAWLRQRAD